MLKGMLRQLFGCPHQRTTFPLTPTRRRVLPGRIAPAGGAYVTCLDCGQEFRYDWAEMRVGEPVGGQRERLTPEQQLRTLIG